MVGNELIYWGLVASLLFYIVFVERQRFRSVGFVRPGSMDALIVLGSCALMLVGLGLLQFVMFPRLGIHSEDKVGSLQRAPTWWLAVSAIRAGVMEELFFRGYAITRLTALTRNRWFAAGISLIAFSAAHLGSWSWPQMIVAAYGGLILTLLFLWRGNLWANMAAHAVVDLVAILG